MSDRKAFVEFRAAVAQVRADLSSLGAETKEYDGTPLPLTELAAELSKVGAKPPASLAIATGLRNALVLKNKGLVHMVARRQQQKTIPHEDLEQAGCLGLIRAIEEYDPERAAFSTFAVFWIRHHMQQVMARQGGIQPRATTRENNRALKHYAKYGELPTSKDLGCRPSQIDHEQRRRVFVSLEEPRNGGEGARSVPILAHYLVESRTLGDLLASPGVAADEAMLRRESLTALESAMSTLTPPEVELAYSSRAGRKVKDRQKKVHDKLAEALEEFKPE